MQRDGFNFMGILLRFLAALFVVHATYNPEGYSYYHWVMSSAKLPSAGYDLWNSNAMKFLAGVLLFTAWVVFLNATRNSLGILGVTLTTAICGGLIWLFAELDWFTPETTQAFTHLILLVITMVLAVGMSWSHVSRRLSGQVDTDVVD